MLNDALLLSIRPRYTDLIFDGKKTVELRRVVPAVRPGCLVLIYESSPTMALVGSGTMASIDVDKPGPMWPRVRGGAGVSRAEYDVYFAGAKTAVALHLIGVNHFVRAIPLAEMRRRWPWLRPPQSYRHVRVSVLEAHLRSVLPPARLAGAPRTGPGTHT